MHELCRHWAPGLDDERAALTVGLPGIASLEAHQELRALGSLLAGAGARTRAAERAFGLFLARHGHRLTGRDLSCPTWRESPEMVVELAGSGTAAAGGMAFDPVAAAGRRNEATTAIERALGNGPAGLTRRAVFRFVLANAQRYYALRENMRYYADFFLARMRQLVLAIGEHLPADRRMADAGDVFWIDLDELRRLGDGDGSLAELARERRRSAERDAVDPPPETLAIGTAPTLPPPTAARVLDGEVGAPGRCRGPARLVHGLADFERVLPGDVLVAAYTDPGWTPVLERAAGLVLEAGGLLSHGAIVARELGIPALVGVLDVMRVIRDGDTVEVNVTAGSVTIVARGSS
jgi:pyruvate,water dikinase